MADIPISYTGLYLGDGQIQVSKTTQVSAARQMGRWKHGTAVRVTIERARATRSHAQNRWYWGVIVALVAEETGHDPDEIHDIFKHLFLGKVLRFGDKKYRSAKSTTQLNKLTFGEYCEQCRKWAAETLGINIPSPEDQ